MDLKNMDLEKIICRHNVSYNSNDFLNALLKSDKLYISKMFDIENGYSNYYIEIYYNTDLSVFRNIIIHSSQLDLIVDYFKNNGLEIYLN